MLKLEILCVGKLKEDYLRKACAEYEKRMGAFAKVSITELPESRLPQEPSPAQIEDCIRKEGQTILSRIPSQAQVITLCIEGEMLSSPQLAARMQQLQNQGASHLIFVIGGSWGLAEEVKARSGLRLSMSRMTFPHQLARVMVMEQLYRALNINQGGKYHK